MTNKKLPVKLISHLPESDLELESVQHRIAEIQAEAILAYISSLPISIDQKYRLTDEIIAHAKINLAGSETTASH